MRRVHCKTTCLYITFRLTYYTTFYTYLPIDISEFSYHHVTFQLTNPSQYATINIRSHVRVHWFDWYEGLLDLLNITKRPSTQMFNLQRRVRVQIFTYEDVSVCNLSPNVLSLPPCFHTKLYVHARVHTLKDRCLHTCWLTKTCLCVPFNISHCVFHLWPTRNNVQPHDFNLQNLLSMQILTYETMPENTDLTNAKAVGRVHCKQSYVYETFWHTQTCLYTTFDMRIHVCVRSPVSNIISHPFT